MRAIAYNAEFRPGCFGWRRRLTATLVVLACWFGKTVWATPPTITNQPDTVSVATGNSVSFSVTATGTPPLTFRWRLNGVDIPGSTSFYTGGTVTDTFSIQSVQPTNGGSYSVVVWNADGTVNSTVAKLLVTNLSVLPASDNLTNTDFLNAFGGTGRTDNFNATRESGEPNHGGPVGRLGKPGNGSVWMRWKPQYDGIATFSTRGSGFDTTLGVYTGSSITSLVKVAGDDDRGGFLNSEVSFNAAMNTEYYIAVDGFYGDRGYITLTWGLEITSDTLPKIFAPPQDKTVGIGSLVTLSVLATNGTWPVYYQWRRDDTNLTGQISSNLTITSATAAQVGNYSVVVTSSNQYGTRTNLSAMAQLQIGTRDGLPDFNAVAQNKFRDESDTGIGMNVAAPAGGYSGSQIFSTYGAVKEPGEPNHCGEPGGASYWYSYQSPANGTLTVDTTGTTFDNILAVYTGSATDFTSLTAVACSSTNAGNGAEVAVFAVTSGTTYYIVSDGVGGATGTVNLTYALAAAPAVTSPPTDATVNATSNATFTVGASGSPTLKYQWRFNTTNNLAGATNTLLTVTNCQATNAGNYTVVITNAHGATTSTVATLTVNVPPSVTNPPSNLTVVQGSNATFTVGASGSPTLKYQWRFNTSNNLAGATNTSLTVTNSQSTNAGNYTVVVTNAYGATTSAVATLTVNVPPAITSQPSSQTVVSNSNVTLTVGASGTAPLAYQWRTNGVNYSGRTTNSMTVTNFSAAKEGGYDVVITNLAGAVTSATAQLYLIASNGAVRLTNYNYATNQFTATLLGSANTNYIVQGATNLLGSWSPIITNSSASGIINFADTNAVSYTNRFYRVYRP